MKYTHTWLCMFIMLPLLASCTFPGNASHPVEQPTQNLSTRLNISGSLIDTVAAQVLTNMHEHSWNPNAMTHGSITGGLFINWKMSNPTITNAVRPGPDGNAQHNHDPQVDLFYLQALAEYHQLYPNDTSYAADIAHMTTLVHADFQSYSLPKGWIYFSLLRSGLMLHNTTLVNDAHTVAINYYAHWYNPRYGLVYELPHMPPDYSTNQSLQCGAALIDAGLRWQEPLWMQAGQKTIDHVLAVSIDPRTSLFYNSMFVDVMGQDTIQNYQEKPSTQGEAIDALVTAYTLTHTQHYLDVARQALQALFGKSGLWDTAHGGFYFAYDAKKGKILGDYKETRSQSLVLTALHHYNQAVANVQNEPRLLQQEQAVISILTGGFYQKTYKGFFYRLTPDLHIYVSRSGSGIGVEDYFTTEAMGSAINALMQTELG